MSISLQSEFDSKIPFWTLSGNSNVLKVYTEKNEEKVGSIRLTEEIGNKIRAILGKVTTEEITFDLDGKPLKVMLLGRKVDESKWEGYLCEEANAMLLATKLSESNSFIETILSQVNSLVTVIDRKGNFLRVSKYFEEFSGKKESELIGKNAQAMFMSKEQGEASLKNIASFYKENVGVEVVRPIIIDGKEYQIHWRNILIKDWTCDKQYLICAGTDITKQIQANKELEMLSKQDVLTELWNRNALEAYVKELIDKDQKFSLIFLDFNEFKMVNDTYGHNTGDRLLKAFAKKSTQLRGFDFVSRIGGDEFLLVCKDPDNRLEEALNELQSSFTDSIIEKPSVRAKFSTGVVTFPTHGTNYEDLFRRVDLAMYHAKRAGLKEPFLFQETLEKEILKLSWLEENFQKALDNEEFFIVLQPKFCVKSNSLCGSEALVRWKSSARGGMVFPDEFIPFAEKHGYIEKLGDKVIELSCKELRNFLDLGHSISVSVNISAKQLESTHVVDVIMENLEKYAIPADLFQIELTETAVAKDSSIVKKILTTLRGCGIKVNLDDFGKGESSLFLLSETEIDILKIDKSFIDKIHTPKGYALLRGIISSAKGLDLTIVAEGVETQEQLDIIKGLDIEQGQGYLYSRPVPAKDFLTLLEKEKERLKSITQ